MRSRTVGEPAWRPSWRAGRGTPAHQAGERRIMPLALPALTLYSWPSVRSPSDAVPSSPSTRANVSVVDNAVMAAGSAHPCS
jgi:hypothetical protein